MRTVSGVVVGVGLIAGMLVAADPNPSELSVVIHRRPAVVGLAYEGQVYVPSSAVEGAFAVESERTAGGGLRLVNSLYGPRIFTSHDPRGPWAGLQYRDTENASNVEMDPVTLLPKTIYSWGTFTYPVTVTNYGLEQYSKWAITRSPANWTKAQRVGNWLVRNQDGRGGWPVPFDYTFRAGTTTTLPAGWYSGMAQGMASGLLAKLYVETGNLRYRRAALRALDLLATPVENGGVQRMFDGRWEWWEEYPTKNHPTYVLNGFMFSLIGVYDTGQLLGDSRAQQMYARGLKSVQHMVNLYDLGDRTAYDLLHFDVPGSPPNVARWGYHNIHVQLLSVLNAITGGRFAGIQRRWLGYYNGVPTRPN
jgi:heparosan-N-sulfate-glucuronate 5-epimerase